MSYWLDKIEKIIEQQKKEETPLTVECVPGITLAEFAKRDIAVEIYSNTLDCTIWLCSNNSMVRQIQQDSPGAVCYTAHELEKLIELNPKADDIKSIHDAKKAFPGSTIIKTKTKEELLDQYLSEMDKEFRPGLYTWIVENDREISVQITDAEDNVNELFRKGSFVQFRTALEEYRRIHRKAAEKMMHKR